MKKILILFLLVIFLIACGLFNQKSDENLSNRDIIEQVKKLGLLENDIEDELDEQKPNGVIELLEASGKVIIVDERQYTDVETPDHYQFLFDKLNGINADIDFELIDLSLEKIEDDEYWGPSEYILVTVEGNDRSYSSEIYYSDNVKISSDYFKVLNRLLTDIDSDYRLFEVTLFCEDENCDTNYYYGTKPVDPDRFGIVSLTKSQAETIEENDLFPICCSEFDLLKTSEIDQLIEGYKEVGLLDNVGADEIESKKSQILLSGHYTPNGLVYYFDSLIYGFDVFVKRKGGHILNENGTTLVN